MMKIYIHDMKFELVGLESRAFHSCHVRYFRSLKKFLELPKTTRIFCGHEYTALGLDDNGQKTFSLIFRTACMYYIHFMYDILKRLYSNYVYIYTIFELYIYINMFG